MIELELFEISKIDTLRMVHLSATLLGALFLILIWYNARKEIKSLGQDWGLIFIAFALLLWAAMDLYRFSGLMVPGQVSVVIKTFSAYNNAFFIASFPFFQYGFEGVKKKFPIFKNGNNWALAVFLANVLIVMFYTLSWGQDKDNSNIIKHFDVFYSVLTFAGLGYGITRTFQNRKEYRYSFVIVSMVITFFLILTQLVFSPFVSIQHFDLISLLLLVSQIALILLLLVLAQSWVVASRDQEYEHEKNALQLTIAAAQNTLSTQSEAIARYETDIAVLQQQLHDIQSQLATSQSETKINLQIKELSERELTILKLMQKSYSEIADELFIARETVISHKKNIESKLGISGKENLVEYAKQIRLIETS